VLKILNPRAVTDIESLFKLGIHLIRTIKAPSADKSGQSPLARTSVSLCVRRSQVRKLCEQIAVSANTVRLHLSICEDRKEHSHDVVGECSAIVRI
jgi:hypothetical protein